MGVERRALAFNIPQFTLKKNLKLPLLEASFPSFLLCSFSVRFIVSGHAIHLGKEGRKACPSNKLNCIEYCT